VIGLVVGTIAANVLSDRSLLTSIFKGFCNAGEAVLVAWLVERWFGRPFMFGDLRRVAGFLVAASLATATSAIGGAATMTLFHTSASFWEVWGAWFLSNGVGVVMVTPLVIALARAWSERPSRGELIEGTAVLALVALTSVYVVIHPAGSWLSFTPGAVVLPLLLWLTARCLPAFPIAGAFVASITVVCAITFGLGRFGDADVPIMERVKGAQVAVTMVTIFTLVLTALFAERRSREAKLAGILGIAGDAIVTIDAGHRITLFNKAAEKLYGYSQSEALGQPIDLLIPARFHSKHRQHIKRFASRSETARRVGERQEVVGVRKNGEEFAAEASISKLDIGGERYFTVVLRDLSDRKRVALALTERDTQLELASKTARVGSFSVDFSTGVVKLTPGCATIYGLPEGTVEMSSEGARRYAHPADFEQLEAKREKAFRAQQREFIAQFRVIRADDGEVRWIEERSLLFYDRVGKPLHLIGVTIDFTEHKHSAQTLAERDLQLALAGRASLVGSYAYDTATEILQVSEGYAAVHGFPEGTTKIPRSQWLAGVHPEDVVWLEKCRGQAFRRRRAEYSVDYRILLPGRAVRWIEARCFITYDGDEHPQRVVGVIIDVTERRQTEKALAERKAQLELANNIAQVGSYTYDYTTRTLWLGPGSASIYGLREDSVEMTVDEWRKCVHPEDLPQLVARCRQALANRQCELVCVFRILRDRAVRWIETRNRFFYDKAGRATQAIGVSIDITERRRVEDHMGQLVAELDHRVKNALATVKAVVSHTSEGSRSVANFVVALEGRIRSMATTHELLSARRWQGVSLAELVRRELAPYVTGNNTEINGPEVVLVPEAGQAMAMVLHELATNAAKYGALSTNEGRVSIQWGRRLNGHPPRLVLEWQESGGPAVIAPSEPSFGMSTIRDLIPYEFGGMVDLVLAPGGVRCRLELPADWLGDDGLPVSEAIAHASVRTRDI
jgi:PAS domain S-box-containing protein